jgi:hypothetical protein
MYQKYFYGKTWGAANRSSIGSCCPEMAKHRMAKAGLLLGLTVFAALLPQPDLWAASSPASCPVNF